MNKLYTPLLVAHVLAAVLGLGSVASVAIVASIARRGRHAAAEVSKWLSPLLRYSLLSLVAMLVTGILLDFSVAGAFSRMWWFRGSVLLLIVTGIIHSRARRASRASEIHRVERMAYGMCVLIAEITVLMEVKPF